MTIKSDVQNQFGRNAESYVESALHKSGKDLATLIELTEVSGSEHALDVATGGGHTANALAPRVGRVIAYDLTQAMLDAAKKFIRQNGHLNVDFVKGDAEDMPFNNETFDIVTCRIAPHHFPNINRFIGEVYRVLKPGGQFLLDDNVAPENNACDEFYNTIEKRRDYSHYRAWKKTEWLRMLELQGFTIQEWHRFEKTFIFDNWCERMNVPAETQRALNDDIIEAPDYIKQKFNVMTTGNQVRSFQGEAIVLKATK